MNNKLLIITLFISISLNALSQKDTVLTAFDNVDIYDSLKIKYVECKNDSCPSIVSDYWKKINVINDTSGIMKYEIYQKGEVLKSVTYYDDYYWARYRSYHTGDSSLYLKTVQFKISILDGDTLLHGVDSSSLYLPRSIDSYIENQKFYHREVKRDNSNLRTFVKPE